MNYRHAFHAGNFADVLKHAVFAALVSRLTEKKDAPFTLIDTHAGIGLYDLGADEAQRTGEYRHGILRLLAANNLPSEFTPYLNVIRALNPDLAHDGANIRFYPGSPEIADRLMGAQDRLILNELHPEDHRTLRQNFGRDGRVSFHQRDGFEAMKALLPPTPRRGLVLIDPAFEEPDEFIRLNRSLVQAFRRWTTGIFVVWYPLKDKTAVAGLYDCVSALGAKSALRVEIVIQAETESVRLNGSGLIIINPPWQFDAALRAMLPVLLRCLERGRGSSQRLDWLINPNS